MGLSFKFYEVGVVDRDLTKFQDCGFLHAWNTACKKLKSHSDLLPRTFISDSRFHIF